MNKIIWIFPLLFIITIISSLTLKEYLKSPPTPLSIIDHAPSPLPSPQSTFTTYDKPTLPLKDAYTILLIGDSMTEALGSNTDTLRQQLSQQLPNTTFGIFNYGYPSQNLNILPQALYQSTNTLTATYPSIINRQFDILIIESFGYNPFSDLPLQQGLQQQNQILTESVQSLIKAHPESQIVFLATIAPNDEIYGRPSLDLSPEVRQQWVQERHAYIQNHIHFAKIHNIPIINVYQNSQLPNSEQGQTRYINSFDDIHPSQEGIDLISTHITQYLTQEIKTG